MLNGRMRCTCDADELLRQSRQPGASPCRQRDEHQAAHQQEPPTDEQRDSGRYAIEDGEAALAIVGDLGHTAVSVEWRRGDAASVSGQGADAEPDQRRTHPSRAESKSSAPGRTTPDGRAARVGLAWLGGRRSVRRSGRSRGGLRSRAVGAASAASAASRRQSRACGAAGPRGVSAFARLAGAWRRRALSRSRCRLLREQGELGFRDKLRQAAGELGLGVGLGLAKSFVKVERNAVIVQAIVTPANV